MSIFRHNIRQIISASISASFSLKSRTASIVVYSRVFSYFMFLYSSKARVNSNKIRCIYVHRIIKSGIGSSNTKRRQVAGSIQTLSEILTQVEWAPKLHLHGICPERMDFSCMNMNANMSNSKHIYIVDYIVGI